MRRVRYSVAGSLDGFIATPDGGYDWIPSDPTIDFEAFLANIDTILMGRGAYETVREGGGVSFAEERDIYVFSRSLPTVSVPKATLVSTDAADFVRELRRGRGKDLWLFGGGRLFASLLHAGLVDTVEVAIVPVLLGEGIPLLPVPGRIPLQLERSEAFPSGIVLNRYEMKFPRPARRGGGGSTDSGS
jgi:dihydrofolate reductase